MPPGLRSNASPVAAGAGAARAAGGAGGGRPARAPLCRPWSRRRGLGGWGVGGWVRARARGGGRADLSGRPPSRPRAARTGLPIVNKRVDLLERWRQTEQIEVHPTDQRRLFCFDRWLNTLGGQLSIDKGVNGVFLPAVGCIVTDRRNRCPLDRLERPVLGVGSPLINPILQQADLSICQSLAMLRRGHAQIVIGRRHPLDQFTLSRLLGDDRRVPAQVGDGTIAMVQPQVCFTLVFVRTVTLEAMIRQNRTDVAVEVDLPILGANVDGNRDAKNGGDRSRHKIAFGELLLLS